MKNQFNLADAIVTLKEAVLDHLDEDSIDLAYTANGLRLFIFDDDTGEYQAPIKFVATTKDDLRDRIGVHVFPENLDDVKFSLGKALYDCARDGFVTVYFHFESLKVG